MKTKRLLLTGLMTALSLFTLDIQAQNCKYKINEIDKFTNKYTKLTKPEKVIGTFYTTGEFSVKKNRHFIFLYF